MLICPEAPPIYRLLSIDPGSYTLGWAIIDLNVFDRTTSVVAAGTNHSQYALVDYPFYTEVQGERHSRLHAHQFALTNLLNYFQPQCVISEAPYLGKFPQAFETLVECLFLIRQTVANYNLALPLETVDPPSAKKAVGASGRGGDKNAVRLAILELKNLRWVNVNPHTLDEHAIDAIAVGCYKVRTFSDDFL
jgi:Holliday junction resolvasome RuvABC endonuclease subunit